MDEQSVLLVYATFPDAATAENAVRGAVERRIAACGNLVPGLRSIYRWQGAVETAEEVLVLLKTTAANLPDLQRHIVNSHPYQVPEVVTTPITGGHPAYLAWVQESCRPG